MPFVYGGTGYGKRKQTTGEGGTGPYPAEEKPGGLNLTSYCCSCKKTMEEGPVNKAVPADLHLHTRLCGHAAGEPAEYLEQAVRQGIGEVGFSDHLPLYFLPRDKIIPDYAMGVDELPLYVEMVQKYARNSPVRVSLGIEADFIPGYEETLAALLSRYPFDYIIGSVHFLDGWGFDNPAEIEEYGRRDLDKVYRDYFALVQQAALSGLFDIIAHPDLIKKFAFRPSGDLRPLYEETAAVFKKAGVCAEVNSAGLRYPAGEIYPAPDFLKCFFEHGVPVTLGSDAHHPDQVGAGLIEAVRLIREAGYKEITVFSARKRRQIKMPPR